jgi:uncharacterized protein YqeY
VESLPDRLRAALNEARKKRDAARTLLLSTILADLKNREIELGHDASDEETVEVLRRAVKKRREAVEAFTKVGRPDAAERENAEVKALEVYLPAAVPADEIRSAVRDVIAGGVNEMGKVMGQVMGRFKGRADGKLVNQIVREELAATA